MTREELNKKAQEYSIPGFETLSDDILAVVVSKYDETVDLLKSNEELTKHVTAVEDDAVAEINRLQKELTTKRAKSSNGVVGEFSVGKKGYNINASRFRVETRDKDGVGSLSTVTAEELLADSEMQKKAVSENWGFITLKS
jgi:hypothetical protein